MGSSPPFITIFTSLLAVDYVSKWMEVITTPANDSKEVIKFLKKNILTRFDTSRALLCDKGAHFCNKLLKSLLKTYLVFHKVATSSHPQASGQVELSNMELKRILEKTVDRS